MDCSPPGSSVHGVLQARILEWVAMLPSRESSWLREQTHISYVSCTGRWILYHYATWEALYYNYKILHICYNLSPTHKTSSLNHYGNSVEYLLCSAGKESIFSVLQNKYMISLIWEIFKKKKELIYKTETYLHRKQNYGYQRGKGGEWEVGD